MSEADAFQEGISRFVKGSPSCDCQSSEPDYLRNRRRHVCYDRDGSKAVHGLHWRQTSRGARGVGILFIPLFGLYLLIRLAVAIFGKWREAFFFACALWALLMPIVIWVIAASRYGYQDDAAKHALVAKLYDNRLPSTHEHLPRLIELGSSCYPPSSGEHCWIVVVRPQSQDDGDIAQDVGKWHPLKSNALFSLMPARVEYGEVDIRRIGEGAYSVLSRDYVGR